MIKSWVHLIGKCGAQKLPLPSLSYSLHEPQVKLPRRLEPECFPHYMKNENQATMRTYNTSISVLGQLYDKVVKNVDGLGYRLEGIFLFFQNPESEIVDASRKFINSSTNNIHVLYKIGKLL
jgi:hypothetical protein